MENSEESVPPVDTSLRRWYPLKEDAPRVEKGSGEGGVELLPSEEGANCTKKLRVSRGFVIRRLQTYDLDLTLHDTPEISTTNLEGFSSSQSTSLQMSTEFMKNGFFEKPKNTDGREEVVEVIVKVVGMSVGID